jgi:hypothetical protein
MEALEPVSMGVFLDQKPLCNQKKDKIDKKWECRIGNPGKPGDKSVPTAEQLNKNMKKDKVFLPSDPPKLKGDWDLDKCTPSAFPYQSHHLIPKMHLPKHKVCVWLAKNAANGEYALVHSTNYDTDDSRNGLALPFASNTRQWKTTSNPLKKTAICNKMMTVTKRQLHQGSHTFDDYGEQDALHEQEQPGYLGAVNRLLDMINDAFSEHVDDCEECSPKKKKPRDVPPLVRAVAAVHQASAIMSSMIATHKVFVSQRAAAFLGSGGSH